MSERTDAGKEEDIYAAMSEIFGPEEEPPAAITPQTLGSILEEATKETAKSTATSAVKPAKVKMKQIKRKSQLDELLVKHKEKLWLESTKVKIIRTKRKQAFYGRKRGMPPNEPNPQPERLKEGQTSPLECHICQRRFTRSSNLRLHLRVHSNERRFQCEVCSKQFRTSSNLHAHLKTHTDERNYPCTVCNRAFRTSRELVNHGKTHSDVKNYVCRLCSKAFVKQSYLNTHMNTVHVGLKRYRCQECDKQFSNSSNLIAHRRVHTGEKPYQCGECDSKFNQSSALTRHIRQQHRPKEPSPEPPPDVPPAAVTAMNRESEPEELSIEVDENRSLESAASSELSVATSLMDSQSFSYGGMPYAQTFVPQPPPPQPTPQHFSHVAAAHQHHHLHHSHLAAPTQQHHPYHRHHHHPHHHQQQHHHHHHPHHHPHPHPHQQPPPPPPPSIIHHQSMAVNPGQMAGANLYSGEYLPPPYHSTALPNTQQTHYELGGYDMCYSMPASTVLNPSLMNPQPTYIFDQ